MSLCCPTCGHEIDDVPAPTLLADVKLSPQCRRLLKRLLDVYPRHLSRSALFDELYGNDPNGGPENVHVAVNVRITYIRRALRPYRWTVSNARQTGDHGRYRLEKIEAAG